MSFSSTLTEEEPVLALSAAGAIVSYVLSALVTHHVIGSVTASTLTQQVVPIVSAVLVLLLGFVTRMLVSPAAKVAHVLETAGLLSDADFTRLEGLVNAIIEARLHPIVTAVNLGPATVITPPAE